MERLTQNDFDMCKECPNNLQCDHAINGNFPPCGDKAIYERLKAYERTGMDPEDVKLMIYCAHEDHEPLSTAYHIRELLQAEQEGRLVVLPCKVGDVIRFVSEDKQGYTRYEVISFNVYQGETFIVASNIPGSSRLFSVDDIGKTVFLTREEAEAALKRGEA